ncbi:MAG: mechanosensitive ion channel family protein [Methanobacteriota archaeon]|nr:MAG: mechanosensitive ion channel family protein [Euryarchaeota archaeon]
MTEAYREEERHIGRVVVVFCIIVVLAFLLMEVENDLLPFVDIDDPKGDIHRLLVAAIVIAVIWLLLHYIGGIFEKFTTPMVGSHARSRSIWKLITYVIWIIVLSVLAIGMIGETGSLVLSIGLIGAAVTFVLQQPLLNVLGWALISYRRIYRIGDRISIAGVKGYVLDVTTMHTELREFGEWMKGDTFTGRIIAVPNSVVFIQPVFNYTKDFPFVWDEIGNLVTYESDIEVAKDYMLESAKKVVGQMMEQNYERYRRKIEIRDLHQLLLREPELRMELADSGVNVYVLYFCPVELRRKIKSDITELIWSKFMADPRVGIAYPHVHLITDEQGG